MLLFYAALLVCLWRTCSGVKLKFMEPRNVSVSEQLCYPQVRWADFVFSVSCVCLIHRCRCRASAILNLLDLDVPAVAASTAPRRDFWPLSQKPDILPVYPVWFSSGGPADSWSPGSAVTSDGTAPEQQLARAFAPDVKGARNQHQICSVGPCAGGRGGPFN